MHTNVVDCGRTAIIHYQPERNNDAEVKKDQVRPLFTGYSRIFIIYEQIYLCDSGGTLLPIRTILLTQTILQPSTLTEPQTSPGHM